MTPPGIPREAAQECGALCLEKRREDRLRALGYEVVRWTWADLLNPARFIARLKAAGHVRMDVAQKMLEEVRSANSAAVAPESADR